VVGAANSVRNIGNKSLPEGQSARRFGGAVFRLTEVWLDK
jgi:hypothetical protein